LTENLCVGPALESLEGLTDCHFHVFDSRFQIVPGGRQVNAPVAEYLRFMRAFGVSRSVIIAPSSYGHDNACMFDAIEQFSPDSIRAIAIPPLDWRRTPWTDWHHRGVRGLRLYTAHKSFPEKNELLRLAAVVADHGWHLQLVGEHNRESFVDLAEVLSMLACPIVFDHFAFAPQPNAERSATVETLRRLLERGNTWVKLSGAYILSKEPPPLHNDFISLAHELMNQAPERMLWGSDWPHTLAKVKPRSSDLQQQLLNWVSTPALRRKVLLENPAELYWAI
jgi:predicted TIM-barrel fold metal-dependent hydrolase